MYRPGLQHHFFQKGNGLSMLGYQLTTRIRFSSLNQVVVHADVCLLTVVEARVCPFVLCFINFPLCILSRLLSLYGGI